MACSRNMIDWAQLKPRILQDLADGKTQQQIRQGLAGDPDDALRVSISKYQLETQLKHWRYRQGLHEPEWKVVSHRINKRRKAGKPSSQVLVNGFIFNERKVAKAINRYDMPTLIYRLPSPQIPHELSHHVIEVRTPPPSPSSLQLQPPKNKVVHTARNSLALHLIAAGHVWPWTIQWREVELSVGQFVARSFLSTYEKNEQFREAFDTIGQESSASPRYRGHHLTEHYEARDGLVQDSARGASLSFDHGATVQPTEMRDSVGSPHVHTAVVKTLVSLLYGLSNQSLDNTGLGTLASIIHAPEWSTVRLHLRDTLAGVDSNIVQAVAEGLFKESIRIRQHKMLELSLDLGADPTSRMAYIDDDPERRVLATPLAALCNYNRFGPRLPNCKPSAEKLVHSLLKRDPHVPNSTLLWIIRAGCHTIAEDIIRSQPGRQVDFAMAVPDLEDFWYRSDIYDPVTPLIVACSDLRPSAAKLSLIRCLLERNAKPDLESMIAAAGACDGEVISLLHHHGAPVRGFIPSLGTPLLAACRNAICAEQRMYADFTVINLLLRLGASPSEPRIRGLGSWELSPLHILALAEEHPEVTEALSLLIEHGADINHRAKLHRVGLFRRDWPLAEVYLSPYGYLAETALEYAIESGRWVSASQLLSRDCELTGREMLFVNFTYGLPDSKSKSEVFRPFVFALLTKAPNQAFTRHWTGLTVLQRAIEEENEDMILAMFEFGTRPAPSDFLCMLCNRTGNRAKVCPLSSGIQMKLVLDARCLEPPITDAWTVRRILAFACPAIVRHVLNDCPEAYDSEGLCYLIARLASMDKISYSPQTLIGGDVERPDVLDMNDLHAFVSRRTAWNRHEDWEGIAVTIAARAGRVDMLKALVDSSDENLRGDGFIPSFLLKESLLCDSDILQYSGAESDKWNWGRLGAWIKYCRMDDPNMRCSPLAAAAMVRPVTAADEAIDLLLALRYEPDGWTVLAAARHGRLSILQRLEGLRCWPHVLSHEDRPDWCPSALQVAVYCGHVSTVRFLLHTGTMFCGIDLSPCRPSCSSGPEEEDAGNSIMMLPRTALQHAVEKQNMEAVTLLVDAGANVNAPAATHSGATALQIASIQGSMPMVQYLLSQGADPHAPGAVKHGRTALQGAAEHGRKDVVELLLAHDISAACFQREQLIEAIDFAQENAQHVVASILRDRLSPQWNSKDEETLERLGEDWEDSSEHSAFYELRAEFDAWEKTFLDLPDSLQISEGDLNSGLGSEEPHIEYPMRFEEDYFSLPQGIEFEIEGHEGLDGQQAEEVDLHYGDVLSGLTLQEDHSAWAGFEAEF